MGYDRRVFNDNSLSLSVVQGFIDVLMGVYTDNACWSGRVIAHVKSTKLLSVLPLPIVSPCMTCPSSHNSIDTSHDNLRAAFPKPIG